LFGIPWLAVMGNHDLGNADPTCACGKGCKQFNGAHRPANTDLFWMQNYYWQYSIPEVNLEIIGLDTNSVDVGGIGGNGAAGGGAGTFATCGGQGNVQTFLSGQKSAGEAFLDDRARTSSAETTLIMQHYPGVGTAYKKRFEALNAGRSKVLTAYGHTHEQACMGSRDSGCDDILTGGGGGWQGGAYFGFTAVHLTEGGWFMTTLETDEVRIPQNSCAYMGVVPNITEETVVQV